MIGWHPLSCRTCVGLVPKCLNMNSAFTEMAFFVSPTDGMDIEKLTDVAFSARTAI